MVYVDPPLVWPKSRAWPYGTVSHLTADSEHELHEFAKALGLKRVWASDHTHKYPTMPHYDLSPAKRYQAIRMGACQISSMEAARMFRAWKNLQKTRFGVDREDSTL